VVGIGKITGYSAFAGGNAAGDADKMLIAA